LTTPAHAFALLLLRLTAGGFLLPHGLGKLFGWFGGPGLDGFAAELAQFGFPSIAPLPLLLALVQTLVGVLLVAGAFTRLAAAIGAVFLAATIQVAFPAGWFWMHRGMEFPVLWTSTLVVIALLGAGAWSVDSRWRSARLTTRAT
jgi:putative oxidoreductase